MFGCLRRAGCLFLVLILAAGLWLTRDRWRPHVVNQQAAPGATWHPVSDSASLRARAAVEALGHKSGPVFTNLTAEELGALILEAAGNRLPSSVKNPELSIDGDRVRLRATIRLEDIRGLEGLGPLTAVMGREETFETAGTLDIVKPGLAEYRVNDASIGQLAIPNAAIPRLLARLSNGTARPAGVADNGIPFRVPQYIGDVRVARGKVTLYKNVQ